MVEKMMGNELKAIRKASGYSRRALAEKCGLHPDSVRYWEKKLEIDLRGYAVCKMLDALGAAALSRRHKYPAWTFPGFGEKTDQYARVRGGVLGKTDKSCIAGAGAVICGAKTRKDTLCQARALPGKIRCKFHGGMSTGPRTAEGRARIAEAQRRRWSRA